MQVSSNCRLTQEEELQLLNTEYVVVSEKSPAYNRQVHDPYSMALVFNRKAALNAIVQADGQPIVNAGGNVISVTCRVPPRQDTQPWPFYADNTILGEYYNKMTEVANRDQFDAALTGKEEPPPGGWLSLVAFHVLWQEECVKVLESLKELAPSFPAVTFLEVRADAIEFQQLAQSEFAVKQFPTLVLMRGKQQVGRVEGSLLATNRTLDLMRCVPDQSLRL